MSEAVSWKREAGIFVAVVGIALVISLVFVIPRHWSRGFLGPDEAWHADLSRHVLEGDGYVSSTLFPMDARAVDGFPVPEPLKQSGISLVTAAVWRVFGESERSVIVIAMTMFALAIAFTQLLAYRLSRNRVVALSVAGLVLANPSVLSVALAPLPTSMVLAAFVLLVLLVIEPTPVRVLWAGMVCIVLMLAKGYGILYIVPILGYLTAVSRGLKLPAMFAASLAFWAVTAQLVLPAGSVTFFSSGSNYSLALLHEWYYPQGTYSFNDLNAPNPYAVIAERPGEFALHYARLASRTKRILDAMAAPAIGSLFFPLLWVAMLVLPLDRLRPGVLLPLPAPGGPPLLRDGNLVTFLSVSILVTLLFFWTISSPRVVYWVHLYPIMLLLCIGVIWRLGPAMPTIPKLGKWVLVGAALVYGFVYPLALAYRQVYKDPFAHLGRGLAVRFLDYSEMSSTLASWVPDVDAVVVSDMSNEISWLNRNPLGFLWTGHNCSSWWSGLT